MENAERARRPSPFEKAFAGLMAVARGPGAVEHRAGAALRAGTMAARRAPDLALEAYQLAAEIDPLDAGVRIALGVLHARLGDFDAARAEAARAFRESTDLALRAEGAFLMGEIALAKDSMSDAADCFAAAAAVYEQLRAADPQDAHALHQLARLALRRCDLNRYRGDAAEARRQLATAESLLEALSGNPAAEAIAEDRAGALERQVDFAMEDGDLDRANALAKRLRPLAEDATRSQTPSAQRALAGALVKQAEIARRLGALGEAAACAERAFAIKASLAAGSRGSAALIELAQAARVRGEVALARGRIAEAASAAAYAAQILADQGKDVALPPPLARELAAAYVLAGDAGLQTQDLNAAQTAFAQACVLCDHYAKLQPDDVRWRHNLSAAWDRQGDVALAAGDPVRARDAFARSLALRQIAPRAAGAAAQRLLAHSASKLGEAALAAGDARAARDSFEESLRLQAGLAISNEADEPALRAMAACFERLGAAALAMGDAQAARNAWEQQRDIADSIDPPMLDTPAWRRVKAAAHAHLASLKEQDAMTHVSEALTILETLAARGEASAKDLDLRRRLARG